MFIDANTRKELQSISYSIFSQFDAIKKVLEMNSHSGFPDSPGKVSGILNAGGKAQASASPQNSRQRLKRKAIGFIQLH
ncbi:hypothetical protein [Acetivibrio cellulolyticus]|uniref:hypothetical protein n=1 Tax=Acetivibrio cellulolyticus TaxID=35830 RepID=UPI0002481B8A|nr:hypothetical protein [Acetivibrio cellulolyticus]